MVILEIEKCCVPTIIYYVCGQAHACVGKQVGKCVCVCIYGHSSSMSVLLLLSVSPLTNSPPFSLFQSIMEQFNPCLRNFVAMGKSYEKALSSECSILPLL